MAKKRCLKATKRVTREWTLHRLAVDDLKLMEPRVDPRWLMAKAMKAEALNLTLMMKRLISRMALEREKAALKASPQRAEGQRAVPVSRQKVTLKGGAARMLRYFHGASSRWELWQDLMELFGMR